jgi:hypothetical protein
MKRWAVRASVMPARHFVAVAVTADSHAVRQENNMSDKTSLVNLGDFAKPANTLIEKISDAIGGIFKPYQIKRIARAEADAEKIRAVAQIEITDLQRRAVARFFVEEAKKQDNMESITRKALPEVTEQAKPEQVEDDWITHFFDKCRLISDNEMQILWAKVLAGQANSPGKYSKRTVEILSHLEKVDAMLFSKLCSFGFNIINFTPLIYDTDHNIYTDHGVHFMAISHLESLGLLHFDHLAGYERRELGEKGFVYYFGNKVWIEFQKAENNVLKLGHVLLTQAGQQLALICGAQPRDGFIDYVKEKWKSFGYKTEPDAEPAA